MTRPLYHGPQLDEAIKRACDGGPDDLAETFGVCLTALDSRTRQMVDDQLEHLQSERQLAETRAVMEEHLGRSPTDEEVQALALRGILGGSFNLGIHAGLALARMSRSAAS